MEKDTNIKKAGAFCGVIKEREPSIMLTIARTLITESSSFFPWEDQRFIHNVNTLPLYYNPLINMILDKLENHDKCVFSIQDEIWRVWYPLDGYIEDITAANEVF